MEGLPQSGCAFAPRPCGILCGIFAPFGSAPGFVEAVGRLRRGGSVPEHLSAVVKVYLLFARSLLGGYPLRRSCGTSAMAMRCICAEEKEECILDRAFSRMAARRVASRDIISIMLVSSMIALSSGSAIITKSRLSCRIKSSGVCPPHARCYFT
eukprot:1195244-Prorocentrum_minimum.AAC.7